MQAVACACKPQTTPHSDTYALFVSEEVHLLTQAMTMIRPTPLFSSRFCFFFALHHFHMKM